MYDIVHLSIVSAPTADEHRKKRLQPLSSIFDKSVSTSFLSACTGHIKAYYINKYVMDV